MSCNCEHCQRNVLFVDKMNELKALNKPELTQYVENLYHELLNIEMDNEYHKCLIDGSWVNADKIIEHIRNERLKKISFSKLSPKVDLGDLNTPVLTTKAAGERARTRFELDVLETENGVIHVVVPDSIYTMSTSFFNGMFGPSIQRDRRNFLQRYHFIFNSGMRSQADQQKWTDLISQLYTNAHYRVKTTPTEK